MSNYVATVTREDGYWVAVVDGLRGGATEARTLDNLEVEVRDLIAGLTDVDEDKVEVELQFAEKHAAIMAAVEELRETREQLEQAKAAYEESQRAAVRALNSEEISARDSARLIGLSYQRVSQILNAKAEEVVAELSRTRKVASRNDRTVRNFSASGSDRTVRKFSASGSDRTARKFQESDGSYDVRSDAAAKAPRRRK